MLGGSVAAENGSPMPRSRPRALHTWPQEGRRIAAAFTLSALGLDLIVALDQRANGTGSSELARIVGGAPTSVHHSLGLLVAHGIVRRQSSAYTLASEHPAFAELVAVGLRLPAPTAAIR